MSSLRHLTITVASGIVVVTLSGCGGSGPSPGPPPSDPGDTTPRPTTAAPTPPDTACTSSQAKCSSCSNGKCVACVDGYEVYNDGETCVASCVVSPGDESRLPRPRTPHEHNYQVWPTKCVDKSNGHFFGLGDWGGDREGGHVWTNPGVPERRGGKVDGPDDWAQYYVARQMNALAQEVDPDFVLNAGDNFYPGGIEHPECGTQAHRAMMNGTLQQAPDPFTWDFQNIYAGLTGKEWYSVLGNHDYGGRSYGAGWDTQIFRTWEVEHWIMPAAVFQTTVQYRDFSVQFFFLDSNHHDVLPGDLSHNICQHRNQDDHPTFHGCWDMLSEQDCQQVLHGMWDQGIELVQRVMQNSSADWHIIMAHHPPTGDEERLKDLGIDLVFTGHSHMQLLRSHWDTRSGIPTMISGGGGGVSSDSSPRQDGNDDAYGFTAFEINRTHLTINQMSWGGCQACDGHDPFQGHIIRNTTVLTPGLQRPQLRVELSV